MLFFFFFFLFFFFALFFLFCLWKSRRDGFFWRVQKWMFFSPPVHCSNSLFRFFCNVCFLRKEIKCILILREKSTLSYMFCLLLVSWGETRLAGPLMYSILYFLISFNLFVTPKTWANGYQTTLPIWRRLEHFSIWMLVPSRALARLAYTFVIFSQFFISQNSLDIRTDRSRRSLFHSHILKLRIILWVLKWPNIVTWQAAQSLQRCSFVYLLMP